MWRSSEQNKLLVKKKKRQVVGITRSNESKSYFHHSMKHEFQDQDNGVTFLKYVSSLIVNLKFLLN